MSMQLTFAQHPSEMIEDGIVAPPHSDDAPATNLSPQQVSPTKATGKHALSAPQSPSSKRPRPQTTPSPQKAPQVLDTPSAPEVTLHPTDSRSHPQPHPSVSPTPQNQPTKPTDNTSPSARRQTPVTKAKHTDQKLESDHQLDSEEEEAPLDLAKISSYEYEQVAKLNPIQLRRYEQYRRSDLKNAKVRKLILAINPTSKPSDPYIIAVKGLAKLFVGDIVEAAIEVKKRLGDKGALQPRHIREAYRRLRREGALPSGNKSDSVLQ